MYALCIIVINPRYMIRNLLFTVLIGCLLTSCDYYDYFFGSCKLCEGKEITDCKECEDGDNESCIYCNGVGEIICMGCVKGCFECRGTGKKDCFFCINGILDGEKCIICDEIGYELCQSCDGSGN